MQKNRGAVPMSAIGRRTRAVKSDLNTEEGKTVVPTTDKNNIFEHYYSCQVQSDTTHVIHVLHGAKPPTFHDISVASLIQTVPFYE